MTASETVAAATSDPAVTGALRAKLRAWLAAGIPADAPPTGVADLFAWRHDWHRALYRAGWIGVDIPREFGGGGLGLAERLIVTEEMSRAGAPPIANWVGVELVAPTLLATGSPAQAARHVPAILDGREIWAQGFSEAEAGSDLAAVTTRAVESGEHFVLDGAKRWSSWAAFADHLLVLARTGDPELRHKSLSVFIVPASSRGIRITPIPMVYGDAEEFDIEFRDVRVPRDAVVGAVNGGWKVLMTSLALARGMATLTRVGTLIATTDRLRHERLASPPGADPLGEAALWDMHCRARALEVLAYRKVADMGPDAIPGRLASIEKLLWGELSRTLGDLAVRTGSIAALKTSSLGVDQWAFALIRGMGAAIEGGTSQIQRNILARELLADGGNARTGAVPREPDVPGDLIERVRAAAAQGAGGRAVFDAFGELSARIFAPGPVGVCTGAPDGEFGDIVATERPDIVVRLGKTAVSAFRVRWQRAERDPLIDGSLRRWHGELTAVDGHTMPDERGRELVAAYLALLAAAQLGGAEAALEETRGHIVSRTQFGSRLADFQAVSHRYVDMYCAVELCASALAMVPAGTSGEWDEGWSAIAAALAAPLAEVVADGVHLHGARGLTNEVRIGALLKQGIVLRNLAAAVQRDPRTALIRHSGVRSPRLGTRNGVHHVH